MTEDEKTLVATLTKTVVALAEKVDELIAGYNLMRECVIAIADEVYVLKGGVAVVPASNKRQNDAN